MATWARDRGGATYAALDLGTNNCRLLIARPSGATASGSSTLFPASYGSAKASRRPGGWAKPPSSATLAALAVCRDKMHTRDVTRARLIATEACRAAENGAEFRRPRAERLGLDLEIVDRETEAQLAATGCTPLDRPHAESVLLFDIGGGSSELVWLDRGRTGTGADCRCRRSRLGIVTARRRDAGGDMAASKSTAMSSKPWSAR